MSNELPPLLNPNEVNTEPVRRDNPDYVRLQRITEWYWLGQPDDERWMDVALEIMRAMNQGRINGNEMCSLMTGLALACERRGVFLRSWREEDFLRFLARRAGYDIRDPLVQECLRRIDWRVWREGAETDLHGQFHKKPHIVVRKPE